MGLTKTGCIYIHTNIISGKSYVGLTTRGIEARLKQHINDAKKGSSLHFHRALTKYQEDTWVHKVLEDDVPLQHLSMYEKYWIAKLDTFNSGYNMTIGGDTYNYESMIEKNRIASTGRVASAETKAKMALAQKGTKASSFKPWWYMTPTGEFVEVNDITQKEFCATQGFSHKAFSGLNHGRIVEQGPMKGWSFGLGELKDMEYVSNVNQPKRKSPTTKGKPRDTSFNHKPVGQYDKDSGELIMAFASGKEASAKTGINYNSIIRCVNGGRRLGSGFVWKSMV